MTEEQLEAKRERDRIYRRNHYALERKIKAEQKAAREAARAERLAARAERLAVRPDAHGRTSDEVAREFSTMTLLGEAHTVRYRGTGFYAGRRA